MSYGRATSNIWSNGHSSLSISYVNIVRLWTSPREIRWELMQEVCTLSVCCILLKYTNLYKQFLHILLIYLLGPISALLEDPWGSTVLLLGAYHLIIICTKWRKLKHNDCVHGIHTSYIRVLVSNNLLNNPYDLVTWNVTIAQDLEKSERDYVPQCSVQCFIN